MMAVGVPLIAPVELSIDSPEGRVGETDQEVTVPPLDVGVIVVIATPLLLDCLLTAQQEQSAGLLQPSHHQHHIQLQDLIQAVAIQYR